MFHGHYIKAYKMTLQRWAWICFDNVSCFFLWGKCIRSNSCCGIVRFCPRVCWIRLSFSWRSEDSTSEVKSATNVIILQRSPLYSSFSLYYISLLHPITNKGHHQESNHDHRCFVLTTRSEIHLKHLLGLFYVCLRSSDTIANCGKISNFSLPPVRQVSATWNVYCW